MTASDRFQPLSGNAMPRFGGPATFMRLPMVETPAGIDVGFIGVPFDIGTSNRPGARLGPRQIRDESRMMSAEECARHIYKATINRKNILILTTQGKFTVFLNKWFPGLTDKLVYNVMAKEANSPLK